MRKLILTAVVAAFAAVPTVSALASAPPKKVTVGNNFFSNKKMTVKPGTKVTWVWHSFGLAHNVTVKSGPAKFHSRRLQGDRVVQPRVHQEGHLSPHLHAAPDADEGNDRRRLAQPADPGPTRPRQPTI